MIFGLMRLSKNLLIQGIATVYIEFFRGTSLLVQLFWVYYVLPYLSLLQDFGFFRLWCRNSISVPKGQKLSNAQQKN